MDLKTYVDEHKISPMEIAYRAKVSLASVYRILAGGKPLEKVSKKISEATGGKVTIQELMHGNSDTQE